MELHRIYKKFLEIYTTCQAQLDQKKENVQYQLMDAVKLRI